MSEQLSAVSGQRSAKPVATVFRTAEGVEMVTWTVTMPLAEYQAEQQWARELDAYLKLSLRKRELHWRRQQRAEHKKWLAGKQREAAALKRQSPRSDRRAKVQSVPCATPCMT